jgi:precorrin-3B synthase
MASGDGLVTRIRPPAGRLTQAQAIGIAQLARIHGNGLIDLSNRANIQLRGVTEASHPPLIEGLRALDLIDPTPEAEARRNIIVTPFWTQDDGTQALADALALALAAPDAPDLPAKFGFALDTTPTPVLRNVSADIWIETGGNGLLLATLQGAKPVTPQTAVAEALALARWFLTMGGAQKGRGRMAQLLARIPLPADFDAPRLPAMTSSIGLHPQGALVGFEFGQMQAETLAALASLGPIRVTPWRMLLIESVATLPKIEGVITDPNDPMLRVIACTGAPGCPQAHAVTRDLARALAPQLTAPLHISGCAKGCAYPAAMRSLTATAVGFDLIYDGPASGIPDRIGLSAKDLLADPTLLSKAP